jgi:hypothetical protein
VADHTSSEYLRKEIQFVELAANAWQIANVCDMIVKADRT